MTIKQLIPLLPKVVKYNLKIIFAGKFIWFLLAAFAFSLPISCSRQPGIGQRSMKD